MQRRPEYAALVVLCATLLAALYPAFMLGRVVAPEASLRSLPPWRAESGPMPAPSPLAFQAATRLGPRLLALSRDRLSTALWDPWIGGGRTGWLSSPAEGGAPLAVVAALLARRGWTWTALIAIELVAAFLSTWWLLRRLGLGGWAAAAGALAYTLSGAMASQLMDWRGSGVALGPLALLPALSRVRSPARHAAAWAAVSAVELFCGFPGVTFLALGLACEALATPRAERARRWPAAALALALGALIWLPAPWLERIGKEPGAAVADAAIQPPLAGVRALVVPFPGGDPAQMPFSVAQRVELPEAGAGYLGGGVLLLALVGALSSRHRWRPLWLGLLVAALAGVWAPAAALRFLGIAGRPLAALAFATAVLAAMGTEVLLDRTSPRWRDAAGGLVCLALFLRLLPPAAHRLPFAKPEEAHLASPLPAASVEDGSRMVALVGAMPPDVGAALGIPDVRAAGFLREPAYASLLGVRADGELPISRALDPTVARLGARWVIEPQPLRLVSAQAYAHIEVGEARAVAQPGPAAGFRLDVPRGACRLGIAASGWPAPSVRLIGRSGAATLAADPTLSFESALWRWYAVPADWPAGECMLQLALAGSRLPAALPVAWDRSGLRLAREKEGARVWEWDQARPFAFLAHGVAADGGPAPDDPATVTVAASRVAALRPAPGATGDDAVSVEARAPGRLVVSCRAVARSLLVAQIKFRPRLWRASLDGVPVSTERADRVWTAVPLPPGVHRVAFEARLPLGVRLAAVAGVACTLALAVAGRR